jgi:signal transduction histidine kinase
MFKYKHLSIFQSLQSAWLNCSFHTKLTIFLIVGATLPTSLVCYSLTQLAEDQLHEKMQRSLQKDLVFFQQQQQHLERDHALLADSLVKGVNHSKIDLKDFSKTPIRSTDWQTFVQSSVEMGFTPSFYLLTDAQGRTIAQHLQVIADSPAQNEALANRQSSSAPTYRSVTVPVGINLGKLAIVQSALRHRKPLAGHEIINAEMISQLGLAQQATIGLRPQKIAGLASSKQPLPESTYPLQQGSIAMAIIAVKPIQRQNQIVGTAIVGTLLNRNSAIVDEICHQTGVSTATVFAYDWRISTNVPTLDGTQRAIGTRVAREVAETVLQHSKPFNGTTNIVGQPYLTAYTPLYDHHYQLNPNKAKAIGILYVGNPNTKVVEATQRLMWMGYSVGGGTILVIGLLSFPLAKVLSGSLLKLTKFAQQVGRSPQGSIDASLLTQFQARQDEIGILARELSQMNHRIETNLTAVQQSELHVRQQSVQLEETLEKLQRTQLQLIQTEKMSGLGQLTAGIAHEINNPINFIHGNLSHAIAYTRDLFQVLHLYQHEHPHPSAQLSQAIEQSDLDFIETDLPKLLTSMELGTQRIREIVLSLRNFSRLDEAEKKLVDIHAGLDSALLMVKHRLQSQDAKNTIQIIKQYGELPQIECYAGLLNQVFMHLFNNAIDALEDRINSSPDSPPHNAPAQISITTHFNSAGEVIIKIADNGIGMSEAVQSKIFDPFYTTKPIGQGTGLGLSISYQIIVEKHAGQLVCRSTFGQGTEFVIQIASVRSPCLQSS